MYKISNLPIKSMLISPLIHTVNTLIIKPGMVFFIHRILTNSDNQLAMNLDETFLLTESVNERLGKQKSDLIIF